MQRPGGHRLTIRWREDASVNSCKQQRKLACVPRADGSHPRRVWRVARIRRPPSRGTNALGRADTPKPPGRATFRETNPLTRCGTRA